MKITRRQLRQIIKEEISRLNEDDIDIAVDSDAVELAKTQFRQSSGGSWSSNMTEENLRMAHDLFSKIGPKGLERKFKFFNDLAGFGIESLRGNLLALGYSSPRWMAGASDFFGRLKGAITGDHRTMILATDQTEKITEIDGLSSIVGLLSTLERLGEVIKEDNV